MFLTCISKLLYKGFLQCQIVCFFAMSSVVCVFFSFRIETYILKFAYNYICLNLFMNYIFQRVWLGLVIQILSLHGFAWINDCLISVNGYFFLFFLKSKIWNKWLCAILDQFDQWFDKLLLFSPQYSLICESTNVFSWRYSKCKSIEALWFFQYVVGCADNI